MNSASNSRRAARRKAAVLDRWGATCWLCGRAINLDAATQSPGSFTLDHVVPRSHGGGNNLDNLRPSHRLCNNERGNARVTTGRRGLRVLR